MYADDQAVGLYDFEIEAVGSTASSPNRPSELVTGFSISNVEINMYGLHFATRDLYGRAFPGSSSSIQVISISTGADEPAEAKAHGFVDLVLAEYYEPACRDGDQHTEPYLADPCGDHEGRLTVRIDFLGWTTRDLECRTTTSHPFPAAASTSWTHEGQGVRFQREIVTMSEYWKSTDVRWTQHHRSGWQHLSWPECLAKVEALEGASFELTHALDAPSIVIMADGARFLILFTTFDAEHFEAHRGGPCDGTLVTFSIDTQPTRVLASSVMDKATALRALHHFYEHGEMCSSVRWRLIHL